MTRLYSSALQQALALCLWFIVTAAGTSQLSFAQIPSTIAFDTDEGSWISLDVAPNGQYLVFELLGDLYQLPIAGGIAKPLISGRDFASQPRFSPNGKQLVFVSDRSGEDNLWLANADGSGLKQLSRRIDGELISPSWSRDGQTIYVSQLPSRRSMSANVELWAYPIDGGNAEKITTPNMGRGAMLVSTFPPGAYGPQATADSSELFFTAAAPRQHGSIAGPRADIMKVNLRSGSAEAISDRSTPTFKPQLSSDGKWLVYGALHNNKTGLLLRNLATGDERWLIEDIGFNALESWASRDLLPNFAFTPNNDSLVIAYDGKIHRVNLIDGEIVNIPFRVNIQIAVEPRVTTSVDIDQGPVTARLAKGAVISPDGTTYAFSAFGRLYQMAIADRTPRKLTTVDDFGEFHPAWSADGTWLAYVTWSATEGGAIWKVPADGSSSAKKLTSDGAYYRNPAWSPDGQMILAVRAPKMVRLKNSRGPLAKAEKIISLSGNGGEPDIIAAADGIVRMHFSQSNQRFYGYAPRLGLSSWQLDGSDQQTHLRVMGAASATTSPAMASDILLSPNGDHALAAVAHQLYLIDMSAINADQPVINVYAPSEAFSKVTTLGSDHFSWGDAKTLSWSAGNTLYRKALDSKALDTETISQLDALVRRPRATPSGLVALRGARIITMNADQVINNGDILINGNRIQAVGKRGSIKIPKAASIINMRGKTIMPGIIDIHAHWQPKRSVLDLEDHNAFANLAYGVTAIRDPQSMTDDIFTYSDAIETGDMIGPRIFSTGRGIFFFNNFQSYKQVYAVLERYKKKYRTHLIKSYLPGSRQVRQWVIRACRELGLIVTAEGGSDAKMNLTFALDGFSGTEHAVPIVPLHKDIIQLYGQSGISYTPTLLVSFGGPFAVNHFINNEIGLQDKKLHHFMPSHLINQRIAQASWVKPELHIFAQVAQGAKEVLDAGGNIGLGGHGEMQGLQVHWEMWALAAGGMSNLDVLRVATVESAKAIGLDADIGSLQAGKLADLVVMDSNPLKDITHTNSISRVMVNGTLYNAATLAQQWPEKKNLPPTWWQN